MSDFLNPDRIVIGGNVLPSIAVGALYGDKSTKYFLSAESAELTKYASNTMLSIRISFANEIARICDEVGGNIVDVMTAMGADKRIGPAFLGAGIGYGGSCFPKDVKAINYYFSPLISQSAHEVNESQIDYFIDKIIDYFWDISGLTFTQWGLSFKPGTDDLRESPAQKLTEKLMSLGATVKVYDPITMPGDKYNVLRNSDALIIATDYEEFKNPDFKMIKSLLNNPVIFDGRNIYADKIIDGFNCLGVGYASRNYPR